MYDTITPQPVRLSLYINHFAILFDGSPQVMLLSLDLYAYFINFNRSV